MGLSKLDFETLIPGTNEVILYALIPNNELMAAGLGTVAVTTLKTHPLIDMQGAPSAYGDYLLSAYEAVNVQGRNFVRATFAEAYTASAVVQTIYRKKPYGWPPILSSLMLRGNVLSPDHECVGGNSTNIIFFTDLTYPATDVVWSKDAYDGITRFKHEIFCSNVQHTIATATMGLFPRSLHFDRRIFSASLPPHLRSAVTIPQLMVTDDVGTTFSVYSSITFPATANTGWVDHPVSDDQNCIHGVWVREKVTALVPDV